MTRNHPTKPYRTRFEMLESREMMAADPTTLRMFLASGGGGTSEPATPVAPVAPTPTATGVAPVPAPLAASAWEPPDWFYYNVVDAPLRDIARRSVNDGWCSRGDMLAIFDLVGKDGTVSAIEYDDLRDIVSNIPWIVDYVRDLASDVILGNVANARFQGQALGNLHAGSSDAQLDKLVDKWFKGADHPVVAAGLTYQVAAGSLFPHAPIYADIGQGQVGDCYFLASLAEATVKDPGSITSMFIVNGDGTYTVRFFNDGKADYLTVDSMLPVTAQGQYYYASMGRRISDASTPLWVALAEKAYAQLSESGWSRAAYGIARNSYEAISGGNMIDTLSEITNRNTTYVLANRQSFYAALSAGSMITFGSRPQPALWAIVPNHGYSFVSYDATWDLVTLFNPWGVNNRSMPGLVTMTVAELQTNFYTMQFTV